MAQYSTLNVKLSNSQINKSKSGIKNDAKVTLNLSPNVSASSNDETNFPHDLLLANTQVPKICKAFANALSANIKFSKTQLSKMIQLGCFLMPSDFINLVDLVMAVSSNIDKIQNLAKKVSDNKISIAADLFKLFKKVLIRGSGLTLTNNEMKDVIKVIRSLENRIFLKGTTRKITSQEGGFLGLLNWLNH